METEDLISSVDDQSNWMERMSARHRARLERSIAKLETRIVDRLAVLNTNEAGNLLSPRVNLSLAQKIHSDLSTIFEEDYGQAARTNVAEYQQSLPQIQAQFESMGDAVEFTAVDRDMLQTLQRRDLAEYARFGQQAQDRIASAMYDNIVAQSPFSALVATIAGAMRGHEDARGRPMARYAEQMANDGIMNFHNAVMMKKAEDLGYNSYLYYGNIIKDSRDFCIRRAGGIFTKDQILSWTFNWKGKSGPAMTHRGGYNCRHHWQPVRTNWIPEGEIEVESWFDRAATPPVSALEEEVKTSNKFLVFQAWKRSVMIDKKPLNHAQIYDKLGLEDKVQKTTVRSWLSQWEKGNNLPKGWQSVVKDLEAELGGTVVPPPPITPPTPVVTPAVQKLAGGELGVLENLSNKQNAFRLWKGSGLSAQEISGKLGGAVKDTTIRGWLNEWGKGRNLPKDWDKITTSLGGEVKTSPAVEAVQKAAEQATKSAAKTALEEARDTYAKTLAEFKALQDEIYRNSTKPTFGGGFEKLTFKERDGWKVKNLAQNELNTRLGQYVPWEDPRIKEFIAGEWKPMLDRHDELLGKLQEHILTIMELDDTTQPIAFKMFNTAKEAKAFYLEAQSRKALFKKTFGDMGFQVEREWGWGEFESAYRASVSSVPAKSLTEQVQRKMATKVYEHMLVEKKARYQWLKLVDDVTYKEERRKVTDQLVELAKSYKGKQARAAALLNKQLRAEEGLRFVPIDLLDSMLESDYKLIFVNKRGRCFYRSKHCTIFETYDSGDEVAWDVISHEWGHAIDGFFNGQGRSGGNWSGLRGEHYVTPQVGTEYKAWFDKQHFPTKSKYTNGDGYYWDDNWIQNYEGRIYSSDSFGEEWFAMNTQRLAYRMWKDVGKPAVGGSTKASWHLTSNETTSSMLNAFAPGSKTKDVWDMAVDRYPELTSFMLKIFTTGRTALY